MENGIINKGFTQISRGASAGNLLSLQALGLYTRIKEYITIPNFKLYKWHLESICNEKKHSFNKAWKELKDKGFLKQCKLHIGGKYVYEYTLFDSPQLEEMQRNDNAFKELKSDTLKCKSSTNNENNNTLPSNTDYNNTVIESSSNNVEDIITYNKNSGIKLSKDKIKSLLDRFSKSNILNAIDLTLANATSNPLAYFFKVLNGTSYAHNPQQPVNNSKKLRFDNFTSSRNYDYDNLERQLLGW